MVKLNTNVSNISNILLYVGVAIVVFFFPTSEGGEINTSAGYTIIYYAVCVLLVLWYIINRYLDLRSLICFVFMMIYMCVASIVSSQVLEGTVAIARIVYILLPALIYFFGSQKIIDYRIALICNELITIIIIIWNVCILFNIGIISEITITYYSQFNWFTTSTFVENARPIFTFGIYSYGAFFYAMLFVFWIHVISTKKRIGEPIKIRYYIYAIAYIAFQILMRSSTALMLVIVMCFIFLRMLKKINWGIILIPLLLAIGVYFTYIQDYDWSRMIIGTSTNGFASRYLSDWFEQNIQAVQETILGIGFTVPQKLNLVYTDSGYVVLFTMGNIVLPLFLYSALYRNLKKNLNKELFIEVLIIMLSFEFSLAGLLYIKETIFMIYFYMSINSVDKNFEAGIKKQVMT